MSSLKHAPNLVANFSFVTDNSHQTNGFVIRVPLQHETASGAAWVAFLIVEPKDEAEFLGDFQTIKEKTPLLFTAQVIPETDIDDQATDSKRSQLLQSFANGLGV
jgi:hypothetical protein